MNEDFIEFEIKVDTRKTPFTQDDVYDGIVECIANIPGWETSIKDGKIKVHPVAAFGPEVLPVISLAVSTIGLSYNVVRNFMLDRAAKKSKRADKEIREKEIALQEKQIKLLEKLSMQFDNLEKQLKQYGKVSIKLKEKKGK